MKTSLRLKENSCLHAQHLLTPFKEFISAFAETNCLIDNRIVNLEIFSQLIKNRGREINRGDIGHPRTEIRGKKRRVSM